VIVVDFPPRNNSNVVNSIGLVCDIIGALLVWRYGLPEPIYRRGAIHLICEQSDKAEIAQAKWHNRLALFGIALVIFGFVIQLVSNFL
jgi:hypothetical protein